MFLNKEVNSFKPKKDRGSRSTAKASEQKGSPRFSLYFDLPIRLTLETRSLRISKA